MWIKVIPRREWWPLWRDHLSASHGIMTHVFVHVVCAGCCVATPIKLKPFIPEEDGGRLRNRASTESLGLRKPSQHSTKSIISKHLFELQHFSIDPHIHHPTHTQWQSVWSHSSCETCLSYFSITKKKPPGPGNREESSLGAHSFRGWIHERHSTEQGCRRTGTELEP